MEKFINIFCYSIRISIYCLPLFINFANYKSISVYDLNCDSKTSTTEKVKLKLICSVKVLRHFLPWAHTSNTKDLKVAKQKDKRNGKINMHTFGENSSSGVPAFLAKLWRLVEDEDTNNLIYWNAVSVWKVPIAWMTYIELNLTKK